jgi:hypothetical protein
MNNILVSRGPNFSPMFVPIDGLNLYPHCYYDFGGNDNMTILTRFNSASEDTKHIIWTPPFPLIAGIQICVVGVFDDVYLSVDALTTTGNIHVFEHMNNSKEEYIFTPEYDILGLIIMCALPDPNNCHLDFLIRGIMTPTWAPMT